ncbi:uncharacterized protein CEXT_695531 [Caerostris extrusa]|uniref:Serine/arginine repetitive matrix protein 1-like n=1 Tax=Caerostris extrusa TaxID=172846 RepID=A0AAV4VSL2_CAEEX|nr:uncharacterized protein CEXT_695531 [Caerostris extrusa]
MYSTTGSPSTISEQRVSSNTDKDFSSTHSLPKVQYDIVRIGVPTVSTTPVPVLKPKPERTTSRQPRGSSPPPPLPSPVKAQAEPGLPPAQLRGLSDQPSRCLLRSPGLLRIDHPATQRPSRARGQDEGGGSDGAPVRAHAQKCSEGGASPEPTYIRVLQPTESEAPRRESEARRRKRRDSHHPNRHPHPHGPWSLPLDPPVPRPPVTEERARLRKQEVSGPAKETTRTSQRQRSSQPQAAKEDGGKDESKSTAKPFKVYYFEPKRKRQRKNSTEVNSAHDHRNRFATERVQLTTNRPPGRARVDQPQRAPRILSDTPRRNHPQALRSAVPSKAPHQSTTREAFQPSRPTSKSPFLRHQPNVGTATPSANIIPGTTQRVPAAVRPTRSPHVRSTRPPPPARSTPLVEPFSLPPGDSFEELIFQPLEIRRIN